jgi:Flp pilus assembly pilin Flp
VNKTARGVVPPGEAGRPARPQPDSGGDELQHLFLNARAWWDGLAREEDGATAVEYALMLALISMAIVAAVTVLGLSVRDLFGGFSFDPP